MNFNVKERLFEMKPNEEAKRIGQDLLDAMKTMDADVVVNRLSTFRVFMHADLKKWKFFLLVLFPERHVCAVRVCGEEERRRGGDFVRE